MNKRVVTFGEIMMRLNPEGYLRFTQSSRFEATYAGGEANVAVSLANYGVDAVFVSKVPAHEIGQCAVNELRRYGVDTSALVRGGERLGVYFCEKGASQRPSKVIYDRRAPPYRRRRSRTSTGYRSLTEPVGSTLQASPPPLAARCPKSAWPHVRPQKKWA